MHKHSSHDSHDELITAGVAASKQYAILGLFEFELHHVTAFDVPVDCRETGVGWQHSRAVPGDYGGTPVYMKASYE
jgi:hypothetical protein